VFFPQGILAARHILVRGGSGVLYLAKGLSPVPQFPPSLSPPFLEERPGGKGEDWETWGLSEPSPMEFGTPPHPAWSSVLCKMGLSLLPPEPEDQMRMFKCSGGLADALQGTGSPEDCSAGSRSYVYYGVFVQRSLLLLPPMF
jgi:hypothetical protein